MLFLTFAWYLMNCVFLWYLWHHHDKCGKPTKGIFEVVLKNYVHMWALPKCYRYISVFFQENVQLQIEIF